PRRSRRAGSRAGACARRSRGRPSTRGAGAGADRRALRPGTARCRGDRAAQAPRARCLIVPSLGLSYRRMLLDAKLERLASSVGGAVLEIAALLLALDGLGPVRRSP